MIDVETRGRGVEGGGMTASGRDRICHPVPNVQRIRAVRKVAKADS